MIEKPSQRMVFLCTFKKSVNFTHFFLQVSKIVVILRQIYTIMEDLKYCYKYPHPAVTTDCVVFGFDGKRLNILLIERGGEPYK